MIQNDPQRTFNGLLTASINKKGVLDVDTVKGCKCGMNRYPCGGCYGLCYANRIASARGFDFSISVSRQPSDNAERHIEKMVASHSLSWFRIGTMGDPSHDWPLTYYVCNRLSSLRAPVVVTKHWNEIPTRMLSSMIKNMSLV
jgi:hypothetical protein